MHRRALDASEDMELRDRITHDLYFLIRIILLNEIGLDLSVDSPKYRLNVAFLERKSPPARG